jgi:hypothetical protein
MAALRSRATRYGKQESFDARFMPTTAETVRDVWATLGTIGEACGGHVRPLTSICELADAEYF